MRIAVADHARLAVTTELLLLLLLLRRIAYRGRLSLSRTELPSSALYYVRINYASTADSRG